MLTTRRRDAAIPERPAFQVQSAPRRLAEKWMNKDNSTTMFYSSRADGHDYVIRLTLLLPPHNPETTVLEINNKKNNDQVVRSLLYHQSTQYVYCQNKPQIGIPRPPQHPAFLSRFWIILLVALFSLSGTCRCWAWSHPSVFQRQPEQHAYVLPHRERQRFVSKSASAATIMALSDGRDDAGFDTTSVQKQDLIPQNYHDDRSSSLWDENLVIAAAASATQQSCSLLGIKSIGVDYGLVRTGVAATVGYNPNPVAIIKVGNESSAVTKVCKQVLHHVRAERASQIIVGLPLHKNGSFAEQTNLTIAFATELTTLVARTIGYNKVPVFLWDERYTSKEAAARAHSRNPDQYLYGTLDAEAACIILEHYYQSHGINAHRVTLPLDVQASCSQIYELLERSEQEQRDEALQQRQTYGQASRRQLAMERAQKLQAEMERNGTLGVSRRKKRKHRRQAVNGE